jgi:DNA-binding NarL/FixJ family response regulator
MTGSQIRVAILEDHQSIIDGYIYRLSTAPEIQVVGAASFGEELEPLLANHPADVLLLDINVPASPENRNPFPVLHLINSLLDNYPNLRILAISVLTQNTLIEALIDAGISGYIFKHDQSSIQQLAKIVLMTASGGVYFSEGAYRRMRGNSAQSKDSPLTLRQMEILSICAAYPDVSTAELAARLGIANSTLRNLLSGAYLRLDVRTRAAAIAKARQMGLLADSDSSNPKIREKCSN